MSQVNSFAGYFSLPALVNPGTTGEFVYKVPAQGVYPNLPSPAQAAGTGLVVSVDPDLASNGTFDGRPFRIRVSGKMVNHASQNWQIKIYQVPDAIFQAGTQATVGNDHLIADSASIGPVTAANDNFDVYADMVWDSVSKQLNAVVNGRIGPSLITAAAKVQTSVNAADLHFMVSFTLASGTGADQVGPFDLVAERL